MKRALVVIGIAAAVVGGGLAGCKSHTEKAGDKAAATVETFQQRLEGMPGRIDAMLKSGFDLGSGTNTMKPDTLRTFTRQLNEIEEDAKILAKEHDKAEVNVQKYFRSWAQDTRRISDPKARANAVAQVDAGKADLKLAQDYIDQGSKQYQRMMSLARELETGLKTDLSKSSSTWFNERFTALNDAAIGAKSKIERLDEQIAATLTK